MGDYIDLSRRTSDMPVEVNEVPQSEEAEPEQSGQVPVLPAVGAGAENADTDTNMTMDGDGGAVKRTARSGSDSGSDSERTTDEVTKRVKLSSD